MKIITKILLLLSLLASGLDANAQENSKVRVKNADKFIFENEDDNNSTQYLKGHVKMEHDSTYMYSDTAIIKGAELVAQGAVTIIQTDSTYVFADSMEYNSDLHEAKLYGNVVLENGTEQLFTDRLFYNTESRIAIYQDTAILKNQRTKLTSKYGKYFVAEKMAHFTEQVVVVDSSFTLHADSLHYNTAIQKVIFRGPTFIYSEKRKIYCEEGFYLINEGKGYFTKNSYIIEDDKVSIADQITYSEKDSLLVLEGNASYESKAENEFASADVIRFDDKLGRLILVGDAYYKKDSTIIVGPRIEYDTENKNLLLDQRSELNQLQKNLIADFIDYKDADGKGYANGDVIWIDSLENSVLYADHLFYAKSNSDFKTYGDTINPLFLKIDDADSMYLSADTLIGREVSLLIDSITMDTFKNFIAFNDVKIWKEGLRGVADSLFYSSQDSTYKLFGQPIIWTDSTEYKGDTIFIKMENNKVKQIDAFKHEYIINMHNDNYYDQIKGKHITSFLDSNTVKSMDVVGSAESIYFLKDEEEAFIGPNHTKCSKITFFFLDDEIEDVKFYDLPESVLTPIQQATRAQLFLSEFEWQISLRPQTSEGIRVRSNRKIKRSAINLQKETARDSLPSKGKDPFSKAVNEVIKKKDFKK